MHAISTTKAPAAIGPYSQAVRVGSLVFLSGQIPLDPATGTLVTGTVELETERVLDNLAAVLDAAGCSFEHVTKSTIFLTDMSDYAAVNEVYAKRFGKVPPARSTVQVSSLPRGVRVEIDCIAVLPESH